MCYNWPKLIFCIWCPCADVQEDDLRQLKKTKPSFWGNKARWPQSEDKLQQWVVEQRAASKSVSTVTFRMKATALAWDMNIDEFWGGTSWCFRFMKRRNSPSAHELPSPSNCQKITKKSWSLSASVHTAKRRSLKRRSGQSTSPTWTRFHSPLIFPWTALWRKRGPVRCLYAPQVLRSHPSL